LPAGGLIHGVKIKTSTNFDGGSINGYTLSVGISGSNNLLSSSFDVRQTVGATIFQASSNFISFDNGSTTAIYATAICGADTLNHATQGAAIISLLISSNAV
jgi:hypothetical protein